MTARFTQADGRGRTQSGTLSLKRPGKIRFEYGAGANMLMVGDGKNLTFVDYEVGQKSAGRSPVAARVCCRPSPTCRDRPDRAAGQPGVVVVRARDARRPSSAPCCSPFSKNGARRAG
jgi:hypothetical protein